MDYQSLKRQVPVGEIDLGSGRKTQVRLLSVTETHAIRRFIKTPQAEILTNEQGQPLLDNQGGVIRDENSVEYNSLSALWFDRFRAAVLAVAMGYTTSTEKSWTRSMLSDPKDGRVSANASNQGVAFQDHEAQRKTYLLDAVSDLLGHDERDGLLHSKELTSAYEAYEKLGINEAVAKSAEGNSGSAVSRADEKQSA